MPRNHDALNVIAELRRLRPHVCSYDEREAGCPVCADIDCLEAQLAALEVNRG